MQGASETETCGRPNVTTASASCCRVCLSHASVGLTYVLTTLPGVLELVLDFLQLALDVSSEDNMQMVTALMLRDCCAHHLSQHYWQLMLQDERVLGEYLDSTSEPLQIPIAPYAGRRVFNVGMLRLNTWLKDNTSCRMTLQSDDIHALCIASGEIRACICDPKLMLRVHSARRRCIYRQGTSHNLVRRFVEAIDEQSVAVTTDYYMVCDIWKRELKKLRPSIAYPWWTDD